MQIDLNKFTKPVIKIAIDKATKLKKKQQKKVKALNNNLLPIEDESEERFKRDEKYGIEFEVWEEMNYLPYDTSDINLVPNDDIVKKWEWLSCGYLILNPKYSVPLIKDAYDEYYNSKMMKCAYCGRKFPQLKKGRTKKYCSASCKQKAYRTRNKTKK